ncbi:unnamed protein product [Vitrella brassicaformis CCMP3155]|uniref:Uncharacterized protein n=1 Tax=Vitrella brassicaformis (strain CCMP3155) TaxID=1169540 RepID=A0A0G4GV39_VITBC|nr:unnamed protein product [Vitrella brassicaformis CCMP3155]|eukprot:CEM34764.1 unnamed protein product [Vitrella brassicaformis CCMP3155]
MRMVFLYCIAYLKPSVEEAGEVEEKDMISPPAWVGTNLKQIMGHLTGDFDNNAERVSRRMSTPGVCKTPMKVTPAWPTLTVNENPHKNGTNSKVKSLSAEEYFTCLTVQPFYQNPDGTLRTYMQSEWDPAERRLAHSAKGLLRRSPKGGAVGTVHIVLRRKWGPGGLNRGGARRAEQYREGSPSTLSQTAPRRKRK